VVGKTTVKYDGELYGSIIVKARDMSMYTVPMKNEGQLKELHPSVLNTHGVSNLYALCDCCSMIPTTITAL